MYRLVLTVEEESATELSAVPPTVQCHPVKHPALSPS